MVPWKRKHMERERENENPMKKARVGGDHF